MTRNYSSQDWHKRYEQQAAWTRDLRNYLFKRTDLAEALRILDVGCGTGVLEEEIANLTQATQVGVDLNLSHLKLAMRKVPAADLTQADGLVLPLPANCFDLSLCHFLLLWVREPLQILREMIRVTRLGGAVLVLAEPDYGGRIDYPIELAQLGTWQQISLKYQGADPLIGRRLAGLLHKAGLTQIETGVLGGQWTDPSHQAERDAEWEMLETDLSRFEAGTVDPDKLQALKDIETRAYQTGERVLFVPTFYGWGRVV